MRPGALKAEDAALKLSFEELGYDVADIYLLSGLSNCVMNPNELADIRSKFASKINEFGLFSKADDAEASVTSATNL